MEDPGLILESGRSSEEGNGNPFQYSCLDYSMDRGAWMAIVHGVTKSDTRLKWLTHILGFPGGSDGKESAYKPGDLGLIPELGRSPGKGNGNSLQYSLLENSKNRRIWRAIVHGVIELDTTERLMHIDIDQCLIHIIHQPLALLIYCCYYCYDFYFTVDLEKSLNSDSLNFNLDSDTFQPCHVILIPSSLNFHSDWLVNSRHLISFCYVIIKW